MDEPPTLLPCPFCGEREPRVDNRINRGTLYERWRVVCEDGCGAEIKASSPEKAIAMWNRRSTITESGR